MPSPDQAIQSRSLNLGDVIGAVHLDVATRPCLAFSQGFEKVIVRSIGAV